jgi:hypothetical protein
VASPIRADQAGLFSLLVRLNTLGASGMCKYASLRASSIFSKQPTGQQAGHWAGSYTGNAVAETLGKFALLVQKYFLLY